MERSSVTQSWTNIFINLILLIVFRKSLLKCKTRRGKLCQSGFLFEKRGLRHRANIVVRYRIIVATETVFEVIMKSSNEWPTDVEQILSGTIAVVLMCQLCVCGTGSACEFKRKKGLRHVPCFITNDDKDLAIYKKHRCCFRNPS